jgi:hypothetical protein
MSLAARIPIPEDARIGITGPHLTLWAAETVDIFNLRNKRCRHEGAQAAASLGRCDRGLGARSSLKTRRGIQITLTTFRRKSAAPSRPSAENCHVPGTTSRPIPRNSRQINLHFEHFHCDQGPAVCTAAGCLHEVYALTGGHYHLVKSFLRKPQRLIGRSTRRLRNTIRRIPNDATCQMICILHGGFRCELLGNGVKR